MKLHFSSTFTRKFDNKDHCGEYPAGKELSDLSERMSILYSDVEEQLIAVLAAGVPANCISLGEPKLNVSESNSTTISICFQFIRNI